MMLLHSCILSVNACVSPISLAGIAQNPRVLSTHYWFWAAFPPAAICTYFFISQLSPVHAQFLPSLEMHWACASCTVPLHPALSSQHRTILYSAHWCFHNTQSFLNSFSVGTSTSCSRSFIMLTMPRATSKFPTAL